MSLHSAHTGIIVVGSLLGALALGCNSDSDSDSDPEPAQTSQLLESDSSLYDLAHMPEPLDEGAGDQRYRVGSWLLEFDDEGEFAWRKCLNQSNPMEFAASDGANGTWVVGGRTGASNQPYIAHLDSTGEVEWAAQYDLAQPFFGVYPTLLVTSSGCALGVTHFEDIGTGGNFVLGLVNQEIALFDAAGNPRLALDASVIAEPVLELTNGDVLVLGHQVDLLSSAPNSGEDLVLARVSPLGVVVWQTIIGTLQVDDFRHVVETSNGLIALGFHVQFGTQDEAVGVAVLDADGKLVGAHVFGPDPLITPPSRCEFCHFDVTDAGELVAIAAHEEGLFYLRFDPAGTVAASASVAHFGDNPSAQMLADGSCYLIEEDHQTNEWIWVGFVDAQGVLAWEHGFGTSLEAGYRGSGLTDDEHLLLVAQSGHHTGEGSGGVELLRRIWIAEIDEVGELVESYGNEHTVEDMSDVAVKHTSDGALFVSGVSAAEFPGPFDVYLVKFEADGKLAFWNSYRDAAAEWFQRVEVFPGADGALRIASPTPGVPGEEMLFYAELGEDGVDASECLGTPVEVRKDLVDRLATTSPAAIAYFEYPGVVEQADGIGLFVPAPSFSTPFVVQFAAVEIATQSFCGF